MRPSLPTAAPGLLLHCGDSCWPPTAPCGCRWWSFESLLLMAGWTATAKRDVAVMGLCSVTNSIMWVHRCSSACCLGFVWPRRKDRLLCAQAPECVKARSCSWQCCMSDRLPCLPAAPPPTSPAQLLPGLWPLHRCLCAGQQRAGGALPRHRPASHPRRLRHDPGAAGGLCRAAHDPAGVLLAVPVVLVVPGMLLLRHLLLLPHRYLPGSCRTAGCGC